MLHQDYVWKMLGPIRILSRRCQKMLWHFNKTKILYTLLYIPVVLHLCLHRFLILVQAVNSTSAARQQCWLRYSKGKSILACSLPFPCETAGSSSLWQASRSSTWNDSGRKDDLFTASGQNKENDDHSLHPTLSSKTISFWWMPTQVCWNPDSSLSSLCFSPLFYSFA